MKRFLTFPRLSILFLGLFGIAMCGLFVFQTYWVAPGERCEAEGKWYDIESRTCATPIFIPDITGRAAGVSRAEASDAKNRELLELEERYAAQQRARAEQTERDAQTLRAAQGR